MIVHTNFASLANVRNPVVTIGTFDGVHVGHRSIIDQLKKIADSIGGESVLLSFYPHPRMVLHPEDHQIELLNSPDEKSALLESAGIDHLLIYPFSQAFSRLTPFEYVRDLLVMGLHAHTIVVGYDHRFGRNREGNHQTLIELSETFGFNVEEIPATMIDNINISSTKVRSALKAGDIREVARYLGYNYRISGTVIRGDGIGRTLGFPTANISLDYSFKLIPSNGVYAVVVIHSGKRFHGVMNIGVRPTINNSNLRSLEVFILEFDRDIYGDNIQIEILEHLREEKKFGSVDELKEEIAKDIASAQRFF